MAKTKVEEAMEIIRSAFDTEIWKTNGGSDNITGLPSFLGECEFHLTKLLAEPERFPVPQIRVYEGAEEVDIIIPIGNFEEAKLFKVPQSFRDKWENLGRKVDGFYTVPDNVTFTITKDGEAYLVYKD